MSYIPADINNLATPVWSCRHVGGMLVVCALLLFALPLVAQVERWDYQNVTTGIDDKQGPRVAIDKWGHSHIVWASGVPNRTGLQLFYTTDATGGFHVPLQVTDTGAVTAVTTSDINPWEMNLDAQGRAHLAFLANVPLVTTGSGLFYTTNSILNNGSSDFRYARALLDSNRLQFDIAVDSLGNVHLVWLDRRDGDVAKFFYMNGLGSQEPTLLAATRCPSVGGCRIGNLDIEVGRSGLVVAFRSDSGLVYLIRQTPNGFSQIEKVPGTPPYDPVATAAGKADLRVRLALDNLGNVHLLYPQFDAELRHRLVYTGSLNGQFRTVNVNAAPFDTAAADFDLTWNGTDRLAAAWTVHPTAQQSGIPIVGFGELVRPDLPSEVWRVSGDLNKLLLRDATIWKDGIRIAAVGDRVVIAGVNRTSVDSVRQIGLFVRSSVQPVVRYIHPDAAAPGMSVVVEAVAPQRQHGSFGSDGFQKNAVRMEVVRPADTARLIFGPSVVSWDGRLVSTMTFVPLGATPGPVPVRLLVHGRLSNIDTFFIVVPQQPGVLNESRVLGGRSRRGVIVVDSLILGSGVFTIDTADTDPHTPGNQGFLPVTILSRGPIRIGSGATLSVAARHDSSRQIYGMGGPGGGGGGTGGVYTGGSGYTGGGGAATASVLSPTEGSGGSRSGLWNGGPSLNDAPGGSTFPNAPGGGGTGHPFGTSGAFARVSPRIPIEPNPGGYGGGSAGVQVMAGYPNTFGGGGGGNASPGRDAGPGVRNGGHTVGSSQLVPLAGGSGGGGGGYASGGFASGGGGGGALALFSYSTLAINGKIIADGAPGITLSSGANRSGGGGGAGGSILLGARDSIWFGDNGGLSAVPGLGGVGDAGSGATKGGDGGGGRIRIDGNVASTLIRSSPGPAYQGPAISLNADEVARDGAVVRGTGGRDNRIIVYVRRKGGAWEYDTPYETKAASDGTWSVRLGAAANSEVVYVAAMQEVREPIREDFVHSPGWVMSSAGAGILGRPEMAPIPDTINFGCIDYYLCAPQKITITNTSTITDLVIRDIRVEGGGRAAFGNSRSELIVKAGRSEVFDVTFCPKDTGRFEADLVLQTNLLPEGSSVRRIKLLGCGLSGKAVLRETSIDLGELCLNDCRETVIRIYNREKGTLKIDSIGGSEDAITVKVGSDVKFPVSLAPGDSLDVPVKLCLKQISRRGVAVRVIAASVFPADSFLVQGTNMGPEFEITPGRNFGNVLVTTPTTCKTLLIYIRNQSEKDRLKVTMGQLLGDAGNFQISPVMGPDTVLGPKGVITLEVTFCPDSEKEFNSGLPVSFGGGSCKIDTVIGFWGRGELPRPKFTILDPKRDSLQGVRKIRFPKTSVNGGATFPASFRIQNVGTARGRPLDPVLEGADRGEFLLNFNNPILEPTQMMIGSVQFDPSSPGQKRAWVTYADSVGGWRDTIYLEGVGAEPGIQSCREELDFGVVRADGTSFRRDSICFYNDGDIADVLTQLSSVSPPFYETGIKVLRSGSPLVNGSLPLTIEPMKQTEVRIYYEFRPRVGDEGLFDTTVTVTYGRDSKTFGFNLWGVGVREHISASTSQILFACEDSVASFSIRNTGTYPLTLASVEITPPMGSNFALTPQPVVPMILMPGDSVVYGVRFTSGRVSSSAVVLVRSSGGQLPVYLNSICDISEKSQILLSVRDTSQQLGDTIYLPVYAELNTRFSDIIGYTLTLTYRRDLLFPLVPKDRDNAVLEEQNGTISGPVLLHRGGQGEVVVTGSILPSAQSGVLVTIPFTVLLGFGYSDSIRFKDVTIALLDSVAMRGGVFSAIDCDTSGGGVLLPPGSYALDQNRPNPFNPVTLIPYSVARQEHVRLNLYDAHGTLVRVLIDTEHPYGDYVYRLDGATLPSGVYTYELISGRFRKILRMVLLK